MMYDKKDDMICSNCGNSIDVNYKYCSKCGNITVYNEEIENSSNGVVDEIINNDVDDGMGDSIGSLKWFLYLILDLIFFAYCIYASKDLSGGAGYGYGFWGIFSFIFTIPCSISCLNLGCRAVNKYNKYCINKSGSRKKLNTLNKISLFLIDLFIWFLILWFVIFFGWLIFKVKGE